MWKWSQDGITITIRAKGRVEFTEDDADVKSLESGGSFEIVENAGWFSWTDRRKFQAYARSDGSVERRYFASGTELSASEGRKWLSGFLPKLLREAAIGADTRVARWLKQSGPDGVLREVGRIHSHWAKQVYFTHLIEQAPLDPPTLTRVLQQAGREIDSDFEHGVVLKKAAARFNLDDLSGSAYADSSTHIGSDFEQRHALAAALQQPTLPAGAAAALLSASVPRGDAGIDSDFELAELLVHAPAGLPEKAGDAYFDALKTVDSDFEHHKVLKRLLSRRGVPRETIDAALKSATVIESDFEQATLLIEVVQSQGLPEPRQTFYDAVRTIQSDFERKRVLSAIAARPGLIIADIAAIATLVEGMSSDFERAEVLLTLVRHHKLSEAERGPVLGVTKSIGSDHERGRVLSAMLSNGTLGTTVSSR